MSNFLKLALLYLCVVGVNVFDCNAEGKKRLSVEEMYRLAEENSAAIKSSEASAQVAEEAIADAKANRLPDVSAQLSLSYLGNGYLWNRKFQEGTSVYIPHFGNNFVLRASQAIYTGGAVTSQINLAKMGKQMADYELNAVRNNVRFMLIGYYLQLAMLNNQLSVYDANIDLTNKVIEQMRVRQSQGTILKNDITRYELQLENLKLQRTKVVDNKKIINHRLNTVIGLPYDIEIETDNSMFDKLPETSAEADWQNLALTNSTALQMSATGIQIKSEEERLTKSERLPKIAVIAEDHLDGPITIEVPPIDKNLNYWFVGVGVSYNISSLFKTNKKVRKAEASTRLAKENHNALSQNVENDVHTAYTNFLTSFTDLNTQIKSVELANQNYGVVNNRFNNGLALITDMTDASNMKLTAELALVNSRINVLYNYYNMKFVTNTL